MATYEDFVLRMKVQGANDVKEVRGTIQGLKGDVESLAQVGGPLSGTLNGIISRLGPLGLAAGVAGTALAALGGRALQIAGDMSDISGATGIAAGTLMNFKNSVIEAGGRAEDFATIATKLNQSIQEAASGNGKLQQAFKDLGVFVTDANGKVRGTEEILTDITQRFNQGELSAAQYAAAIDILGKNVNKLELQKLQAVADPVTTENIRKLDQFNEMLDKVRARLEKSIVTFFIPALEQATKYYNYIVEQEGKFAKLQEEAAQRGNKIVTDPRTGIRNEVPMSPRDIAERNLNQSVNEMTAQMPSELARLQGRLKPTGGGFGTKPKEQAEKEKKEAEQLKKELEGQVNAVKSLGDNYRRAAQANMDRLVTEMDILGLSKEEQDTIRGTAQINERYGNQIAALEDKRKGAKGQTLELIDKEIANLEGLRTSELDIFNINREKTRQYARQQQEIKNIVDLMELQAETAREIAQFQTQQDQAVLAAFEQVRAQREALELTGQREQLEKSIQNLRGSDQAAIKELFDLEQQRKVQLEAIQKIQNLPFEGVGGMKQRMQEINDLYDQRRAKIEQNAAATKAEQNSFSSGWAAAGEKYRNSIKTDAEYAAQQMQTFTQGFENAFVKFVQTGKLSFKDLANSMIADFARVQAQKLLTSFMGGGKGGGFLGSLFGGFFANGGTPPMNKVSVVGENGPELFVPKTAGTIVPNGAFGGGQIVNNTAVTYSIQAVDASSFRTLLARDPEFIHNVAEQGRRQLPIRSRR